MNRFIVCCSVALSLQAVSGANFVEAATEGARARTKPGSEASQKLSEVASVPQAVVSAKLDALAKFVAAGDAGGLAGLWTEDGTYVDDSGTAYQGRDVLQKRFASTFASGEKPTLSLKQTKTQALAPNVIVSEGTVVRQIPAGESITETRFAFVFIKKGSDWLISSATETPVIQAADDGGDKPKVSLSDLSWMLGDWESKHDGQSLKLHVDWVGNKNFLRWSYQISKPGETQDNVEVIAYDAKSGSLVSFCFDANGAFGQSDWSGDPSKWQLECVKTASDGSTLTARQIITPKSKDDFTWQSVDRTSAGLPLPDTGELQITRQKLTQ